MKNTLSPTTSPNTTALPAWNYVLGKAQAPPQPTKPKRTPAKTLPKKTKISSK